MAKKVKLVKNGPTPKQIITRMRQSIAATTNPVMLQHVSLRDLATQGWSVRNKPKVVPETLNITNPKKPLTWQVILYAPKAESASISVYRMLNNDRGGGKATKVRHALMAAKFQAKTAPNTLGQQGAGGEPVAINKNLELEGIDARNWDELITVLLDKEFRRAIQKGGEYGLQR